MKRIILSIIVLILTLSVFATPVLAAEMSVSNGTVPNWSVDSEEPQLVVFRLYGLQSDPFPKSALVKDTQGNECIKIKLRKTNTQTSKDVLLRYNSNGYNHGGYLIGLSEGNYVIDKIYGFDSVCLANHAFPVNKTDTYQGITVFYGSDKKNLDTVTGKYVWCEQIAFTKRNYTLQEGDSVTVTPSFAPNDCTNKELRWVSSDEKVVTIKNNTIKAVGVGRAALTCYHEDGPSQTITITVHPSENSTIVDRPTQPTEPEETTKPSEPEVPETKPSEPSKPNDTPTTQPTTPPSSTPKDEETTPPETTVKPPVNDETVDPDTSSPNEEKPDTDHTEPPETEDTDPSEPSEEKPKNNARLKEVLGAVISFLILVVLGLGGWLVYKKYFYDKY